ncbi:MAG TPA: hypothetical protein PKY29_09590 [Ferruginibacter sp.]|nr:hypothetical protein [Ferruginibacter sp.]HRO17588.1 hypothetical protein [Ferruginibacter sp.]HRQ21556.1 hypothetical protein [Ferruginibacter sp.]
MDSQKKEFSGREKGLVRMRSIMDFAMGTLWLSMGFFLIFFKKFDVGLQSRLNDPMMKIFGGVCILYGIFRLYRGYKKNYFRS